MSATPPAPIPFKTARGVEELRLRTGGLGQRHRTILFLIDGRRHIGEVMRLAQQAGAAAMHFEDLVRLGYVALPHTEEPAAAAVPEPTSGDVASFELEVRESVIEWPAVEPPTAEPPPPLPPAVAAARVAEPATFARPPFAPPAFAPLVSPTPPQMRIAPDTADGSDDAESQLPEPALWVDDAPALAAAPPQLANGAEEPAAPSWNDDSVPPDAWLPPAPSEIDEAPPPEDAPAPPAVEPGPSASVKALMEALVPPPARRAEPSPARRGAGGAARGAALLPLSSAVPLPAPAAPRPEPVVGQVAAPPPPAATVPRAVADEAAAPPAPARAPAASSDRAAPPAPGPTLAPAPTPAPAPAMPVQRAHVLAPVTPPLSERPSPPANPVPVPAVAPAIARPPTPRAEPWRLAIDVPTPPAKPTGGLRGRLRRERVPTGRSLQPPELDGPEAVEQARACLLETVRLDNSIFAARLPARLRMAESAQELTEIVWQMERDMPHDRRTREGLWNLQRARELLGLGNTLVAEDSRPGFDED